MIWSNSYEDFCYKEQQIGLVARGGEKSNKDNALVRAIECAG